MIKNGRPKCNFLMLPAGGPQKECGEPATRSRNGRGGLFHYCDIHAQEAERSYKRAGKTLILSPIADL